ncbi:hypothetical protein TNIN_199301 [Trichonephila inaurata madagascariensis]|uniref:Uncharacterized protein n=1 Tax=Trichonephila inaurata madagascariensis TaxID=2747483 RepID=A0A8X6X3U1_9ARAC|nr:hypothetical protein TNIN_199301 [Trichonephila inaurata madagascariensis]
MSTGSLRRTAFLLEAEISNLYTFSRLSSALSFPSMVVVESCKVCSRMLPVYSVLHRVSRSRAWVGPADLPFQTRFQFKPLLWHSVRSRCLTLHQSFCLNWVLQRLLEYCILASSEYALIVMDFLKLTPKRKIVFACR